MNKRLLIPLLLWGWAWTVCSAQKEDYVWLLGRYGLFDTSFTLSFNTNPPSFQNMINQMGMSATMASICDGNGDLLYYTNGIQIRDANHQIIQNGMSVNEGYWANTFYSTGYPGHQNRH